MSFFLLFLRRLAPSRRSTARLALLALLIHAAVLGLHQPPGLLVAMAAEGGAHCADYTAPGHPDESDPAIPGHTGTRCPFCTLVQGGKLLVPSPCLVFPPAGAPVAMPLPASESPPFAISGATHWPRGPPADLTSS